jgi:protein-S-isoprenylcysteine O-methyltransferase Ste14
VTEFVIDNTYGHATLILERAASRAHPCYVLKGKATPARAHSIPNSLLMPETIIFIAGTAGLIYVSRASLRAPASHGLFRFLAWEGLLILLLLNMRAWFEQPFSAHQLLSWALLLASLVVVILGVAALRRRGKPGERQNDVPLIGIEKTTILVTDGIFGYIRHPLYASLLLLACGIFFKRPSLTGALLALVTTVFLLLTARREEAENIRFFGDAYCEYMKHTKMFVPIVF